MMKLASGPYNAAVQAQGQATAAGYMQSAAPISKAHLPRLHERLANIANAYADMATRAENMANRLVGIAPTLPNAPAQTADRPQPTGHVGVFDDACEALAYHQGRLTDSLNRLEQAI